MTIKTFTEKLRGVLPETLTVTREPRHNLIKIMANKRDGVAIYMQRKVLKKLEGGSVDAVARVVVGAFRHNGIRV